MVRRAPMVNYTDYSTTVLTMRRGNDPRRHNNPLCPPYGAEGSARFPRRDMPERVLGASGSNASGSCAGFRPGPADRLPPPEGWHTRLGFAPLVSGPFSRWNAGRSAGAGRRRAMPRSCSLAPTPPGPDRAAGCREARDSGGLCWPAGRLQQRVGPARPRPARGRRSGSHRSRRRQRSRQRAGPGRAGPDGLPVAAVVVVLAPALPPLHQGRGEEAAPPPPASTPPATANPPRHPRHPLATPRRPPSPPRMAMRAGPRPGPATDPASRAASPPGPPPPGRPAPAAAAPAPLDHPPAIPHPQSSHRVSPHGEAAPRLGRLG